MTISEFHFRIERYAFILIFGEHAQIILRSPRTDVGEDVDGELALDRIAAVRRLDRLVYPGIRGRAEEPLNFRDSRFVALVAISVAQRFNFLLVERPEARLGAYIGVILSVPA